MQSANLSGPFRGCLYYALLGLPQATGLAGGYDYLLCAIMESKHLDHNDQGEADWKTRKEKDQ